MCLPISFLHLSFLLARVSLSSTWAVNTQSSTCKCKSKIIHLFFKNGFHCIVIACLQSTLRLNIIKWLAMSGKLQTEKLRKKSAPSRRRNTHISFFFYSCSLCLPNGCFCRSCVPMVWFCFFIFLLFMVRPSDSIVVLLFSWIYY